MLHTAAFTNDFVELIDFSQSLLGFLRVFTYLFQFRKIGHCLDDPLDETVLTLNNSCAFHNQHIMAVFVA